VSAASAPVPPTPLVLVVDDNEAIRYAFSRALRNAGLRTAEAGCGEEALALVARQRPDLVVLDLRLPDMS